MMSDKFKNIPQEMFEGDVTKSGRLSSKEVHELANKLLAEGFDKIKRTF